MSSFRFLHAADVHLDSPLRGLESYPGAPAERIRMAARQAMDNVVQLCIHEKVDLLILAGDLFDTDCRDFQSVLSAVKQLQTLQRAGIPAYLILGNHDSHFEKSKQIPWPSNVTVFDHRKAHTVSHPSLPIVLHGMSYAKREVTENLVPGYPAPVPGMFNVGVLHTNAGGNADHDSYAPCSVEELVAKGYDYWALGHVHEYQILHSRPMIAYSGNTQGRHVRETGRKGCILVDVEDGEIARYEFRDTDVMRWYRRELNIDDANEESLRDRVRDTLLSIMRESEGRLSAVRLILRGRTELHHAIARDAYREQLLTNLRADANELSDDIWIEKIRFETKPPIDKETLKQSDDLLGQLLRDMGEAIESPEERERLMAAIQPVMNKVAADIESVEFDASQGSPQNEQQWKQWLQAAEDLLISHLVEERK